MNQLPSPIYEFDDFRLDASKRLLWRNDAAVPLTSKCFETLLALVEGRGETLEKDALLSRIWPDTVVEEKNLTINISMLRKALGESPQEHRYIVTVPGRGYRFVAELREFVEVETELLVEQSKVSVVVEEEEAERWRERETKRRGMTSIAQSLRLSFSPSLRLSLALSLLLVVAAAYWWHMHQSAISTPHSNLQSLAVLPFKSLNPSASEDYFGVGLADVTITRLSSLNQLIVRPTRAVLPFAAQDPLQAGQTLKVDSVLDGSIQQSDNRVRVTLRLLRVADGQALWTYQCDEYCTDVFALQDTISQKVTEALAVKLTNDERERLLKRYTRNYAAYQEYLKGRYYANRVNEDDLKKALAAFREALRLDPNYALADAGLATVYANGSQLYWRPHEAMPQARALAASALQQDEQLAEAHVALGRVRLFYDWDHAGAEREFKRAIELNPGLSDAYLGYGELLALLGRFDESIAEMKRGTTFDPLSASVAILPGMPCFLARRYDDAIGYAQQGLALDPGVWLIQINLGLTYAMKGDAANSLATLQRVVQVGDNSPVARATLALAYARAGRRNDADAMLQQLLNSRDAYVIPYFVAIVYAALGDKDQAFAWLEKNYAERSGYLVWLKTDPRMDSLRGDPRFAQLLQRVGLTS